MTEATKDEPDSSAPDTNRINLNNGSPACYAIGATGPAFLSPILFYFGLVRGVQDDGFMYMSLFFSALLWGGFHLVVTLVVNSTIIRLLRMESVSLAAALGGATILAAYFFHAIFMFVYGRTLGFFFGFF